jgi:hypothetical protein
VFLDSAHGFVVHLIVGKRQHAAIFSPQGSHIPVHWFLSILLFSQQLPFKDFPPVSPSVDTA